MKKDSEEGKIIQTELKRQTRIAKVEFKFKIELNCNLRGET